MARAPRSGGSDPEPIEFGIPVLDDRLEDAPVSFPAERNELQAAVGSMEIPYDASGHTLTLGDALGALEQDEFETKHDLLDALHPEFERYRQRRPTGLFERIRSLLPF